MFIKKSLSLISAPLLWYRTFSPLKAVLGCPVTIGGLGTLVNFIRGADEYKPYV
nr:hypothetical protein [Hyphomonas sp.]